MQSTATTAAHPTEHDQHDGHAHVMPLPFLFATFGALVFLTIITVTASKLSLGAAEIWVAMGIATAKAGLVALYFMHLRYDKPFNSFLFLFSLVFAAIFIGLALVDSTAYQPEVEMYDRQNVQPATPAELAPPAVPATASPAA